MNRRQFFLSNVANIFFASIALQATQACDEKEIKNENEGLYHLNKFEGTWDFKRAAFLLRRTTFGISSSSIKQSVSIGMNATISKLFEQSPKPLPPLNYDFKDDIYVPVGKTWVNAPYLKEIGFEQYRKKSLNAWAIENLLEEGFSIREQLTLFWHNYFGVSDIGEHKFEYVHNQLLREFAFGNFKKLLYRITTDPAMLEFLNGNLNSKGSPNENYAREMLELFTVGKAKLSSINDYTTFTEQDVREVAKVLTGWQHEGFFTFNPDDLNKDVVKSHFNFLTHDNSIKHLSHRFNNAIIPDMFGYEYKYLINIICNQEHTAQNVCRRLYRWFVYHQIDEEVEKFVIVPLSKQLMANNYEIIPILTTLLSSNHFFEASHKYPKIKNPIEYTSSILKCFKINVPVRLADKYTFNYLIFEICANMGMEYFFPPSVAGWKAYYQKPLYYKFWINASTLQVRKKFADDITINGIKINNSIVKIDILFFLKSLENPENPSAIVEEISNLLLVQELSNSVKDKLKNILLSTLTEDEWSRQLKGYYSYATEKQNTIHIIEKRLTSLLSYIFCMPEFNIV